ncbi:hypothetical protein [Azospirillum sp.]|uniref:hypothetical protein n=1 Tax=Azospirillum sp. TaxID=34012 RepID=UPI00262A5AEF|nr:hypothetical protein [Azospirillum sp.]
MSSPDFNSQRYLNENPDVAAAVARGDIPTAWDHFRLYGQKEGRNGYDWSGSPIQADLAKTPDLKSLLTGGGGATTEAPGGVAAIPGFNAAAYLKANPDVAAAVARGDTTAEQHWAASGRKEGRKGGFTVNAPTAFDDAAYLKANPDVAAAAARGDTTAQEHFLQFGQKEGRQAFYLGGDARTPGASAPAAGLSADIKTAIDRYANVSDATGLTPGSLADSLAREVIQPYRDMLRNLRDGKMTEAQFRVQGAPLASRRETLLSQASPDEFSDAIRYAGKVTPDFLESVTQAGASAVARRTAAGSSAASALSASDQATKDLQAAAEQAANRERVRSRRGRGALMLTGLAGLTDGGTGSVARRLLMGA